MSFYKQDEKGHGIVLERYNDRFSLKAAEPPWGKSKEAGEPYSLKWCKIKKWNPDTRAMDEVSRPISLYLGDRDAALTFLEWAIRSIKNSNDAPPDDTPF